MVTAERREEIIKEREGVVTVRGTPKLLEIRCPQKGGTQ